MLDIIDSIKLLLDIPPTLVLYRCD